MVEPIVLASQVAAGLGALAGVAIAKTMADSGGTARPWWESSSAARPPRCPSCGGSGRVACLCSRWSDGDFGCRSCAGSGRMACRSCGGSGTGRPLPVQIRMTGKQPRPYDVK